MLIYILISLLSACIGTPGKNEFELLPYESKADPKAIIISGKARFTVLTSQTIRFEYDDNFKFEDRATLTFLNRFLSVPPYNSFVDKDNKLHIRTKYLNLLYEIGKEFTKDTLFIEVNDDANSTIAKYYFNQSDPNNLLGTIKCLDEIQWIDLNCTVNRDMHKKDEDFHCAWGLMSRSGWSAVQDQDNYIYDDDWWHGQNPDKYDFYFFGHGLDYKQSLRDFTSIAGRIPIPPKYSMGIWFTKWSNYNFNDIKEILYEFSSKNLPLDVLVLDMNWHKKNDWTGYSWDKNLFPVYKDLVDYIKLNGLGFSANLHDLNGVGYFEDKYYDFAKYMGFDPSTKLPIKFDMINSSYSVGLDNIVMKDLGFDFWWIDWQQGGQQGGCKGKAQNPTFWLNKIRSTDNKRRGENIRSMVLARWGGLGNHRYPVGFSGDVKGVEWTSLRYQPYFSATGSNVGYGQWSHDIVGPGNDHELMTRWIQWATYSAIFRFHDRGMNGGSCNSHFPTEDSDCCQVYPWVIPSEYFTIIRKAIITRERLLPYIYTAYRESFESGVSIIRPVYYEFPSDDGSYYIPEQNKNDVTKYSYFFGNSSMLVTPIVTPAHDVDNMARADIYLPSGKWYSEIFGNVVTGPTTISSSYDLSEIPIYLPVGTIIPTIPEFYATGISPTSREYTKLEFTIYPESKTGFTQVYDDDGITLDYLNNKYSTINCSYEWTSNTNIKISVQSSSQIYIYVILRIVNVLPANDITINGYNIPYSRFGSEGTWTWDGNDVSLNIESYNAFMDRPLIFSVNTEEFDSSKFYGIKGLFRRANLVKNTLDETRTTSGSHSGNPDESAYLNQLSSMPSLLENLAHVDLTEFKNKLNTVKSLGSDALDEVKKLTMNTDSNRLKYSVSMLSGAQI